MKKTKKDGIISLAFSYIKGYKKNTVLSIMGIAFSVTLMFSLLQMGERVLLQFRHMIGDYPTADFQIRNFDFDELDEIYSWLEEHHSEYTMYKKATYASGLAPNGMTAIIIEGVEGAWKELPPREFIAGKEPEKYGEICVEEKYCAMLGKTPEELVGESLKLTVHDDDYKEPTASPAFCQIPVLIRILIICRQLMKPQLRMWKNTISSTTETETVFRCCLININRVWTRMWSCRWRLRACLEKTNIFTKTISGIILSEVKSLKGRGCMRIRHQPLVALPH